MGLLQSLVDILGSNEGSIALAVAAAVALGTPIVDRLVIRRKRIQYQVVYNSKIGLSPVLMDADGDEPAPLVPPNPELAHVSKLLDRLSVVIIRIRNTGSYDIGESDFEPPLSFTFGPRVVWNARISEASDPMLRRHIRENLRFFTNADTRAPQEVFKVEESGRNLSTLRRLLGQRMSAFLTPPPAPVVTAERPPQWHGVRLTRMWLRRNQSFILVVVLREADESSTTISKEYHVTGGHSTGKTIIDEKRQRRFGWPVIVPAIGVMLVGALLATLIISRQHRPTPGIPCAPGTVRIEGSSAFGPTAQALATTYMADCPGAHVDVAAGGSIDGVRDLAQAGAAHGANLIALSDGAAVDPTAGLSKRLVAVLVYSVVINRGVGIDHLTTAQLAGIYAGRYTNWSQLGGPDLPIRIVGRGAGSGTRQALETYVLNGSQGELSSDGCLTRDRLPAAPTILCERANTDDEINTVAAVPGAIGYGDVANATTKAAVRAGSIVTVELNGRFPLLDTLPDYPFWTVEYLYTVGTPPPGSAMRAFLDYLASDSAQAALLSAGYTPCVPRDGVLNHLCTLR